MLQFQEKQSLSKCDDTFEIICITICFDSKITEVYTSIGLGSMKNQIIFFYLGLNF